MKNKRSGLILSIGLFIMMMFIASPVLACSPSEEAMQITREERIEGTPMILVGTAVEGFTGSYTGGYEVIREVNVEVESYLRGEGPTRVRISGFGQGADCRSVARLNERAIFLVSGNPATGLYLINSGGFSTVWDDSPENIEMIVAITGENNPAYPLPLTTQLIRFVMEYAVWIVGLIVLLMIVFWRRTRDPRKPKAKRS